MKLLQLLSMLVSCHCYKKTNITVAISQLEEVINCFSDIRRLNLAARYYKVADSQLVPLFFIECLISKPRKVAECINSSAELIVQSSSNAATSALGKEKGDRPRTYLTPPMDGYFIDLLLDQVNKGNTLGHTFIIAPQGIMHSATDYSLAYCRNSVALLHRRRKKHPRSALADSIVAFCMSE